MREGGPEIDILVAHFQNTIVHLLLLLGGHWGGSGGLFETHRLGWCLLEVDINGRETETETENERS